MTTKPAERLTLHFANSNAADASKYARDLVKELPSIDETLTGELVRTSASAMNFGDAVQVIVASGAATALAQGLAVFMRRNSGAKITIVNDRGTVVAELLNSADAARIAEAAFKSVEVR